MELHELKQGEQFLIETLRYFDFLCRYGYVPSELSLYECRNEYSVTFYNNALFCKIKIRQNEDYSLDVVFISKRKSILGRRIEYTKSLQEMDFLKGRITSLKTLANVIQSNCMNIITTGRINLMDNITTIRNLKRRLSDSLKNVKSPAHKIVSNYDLLSFKQCLLGIDLLGEGFYIKRGKKCWEVFYLERNTMFNCVKFDTEEQACIYFYDWVKKSNSFKSAFDRIAPPGSA
jgi:hypothetical protein